MKQYKPLFPSFCALLCLGLGAFLYMIGSLAPNASASGILALPPDLVYNDKSNTWTGSTSQSWAGVSHTLPMIVVANVPALPATGCTAGELAIVTAATPGQQMYQNSGTGACVWTQQLNSGTSTGGGISVYSSPASVALTGTQFFPIGGGGTPSTTETNVDVDSPSSATVANFFVQLSGAPGMGNSVAFTARKNASDQALTCTAANAATSCSDTTHSFMVAQGDLLTVKAVTTGTILSSLNVIFAVQFGQITATGSVNNCASAGAVAYYTASGTAVSCQAVTGLGKFGSGAPAAAVASDVVNLFTGCSGVLYLGADGACHASAGGAAVGYGAYSGLPGSCTHTSTQSDLYYANDSIYALSICTATNTFTPTFLNHPATAPPNNFTGTNMGSATVTTLTGGPIRMHSPSNAGNNINIQKIAAPATPYTITGIIQPRFFNTNFYEGGLALIDSVGGGLIVCGVQVASGNFPGTPPLGVNAFGHASVTSSGSSIGTGATTGEIAYTGVATLQIGDDGTNVTCSYSEDLGNTFFTLYTAARATFLGRAPNQVGWVTNAINAESYTTLISWH